MNTMSRKLERTSQLFTYDTMGARELRLLAIILLQDSSDRTQQLLVRQVWVLLWKGTCDCQSMSQDAGEKRLTQRSHERLCGIGEALR